MIHQFDKVLIGRRLKGAVVVSLLGVRREFILLDDGFTKLVDTTAVAVVEGEGPGGSSSGKADKQSIAGTPIFLNLLYCRI